MKITKEKMVYFLSLNGILNLMVGIIYIIFYINSIKAIDKEKCFSCTIIEQYHYNFILILIFSNLFVSLSIYFYSFFKKENFEFDFICILSAILMPLISVSFLFFSDFKNDIKSIDDFFGTVLFLAVLTIGFATVILSPFTYGISFIILKITDPLRRKIKW